MNCFFSKLLQSCVSYVKFKIYVFLKSMSIRSMRLKIGKILASSKEQLLAHPARFLSLATKISSSVVCDEKEFLACLILKIVVNDKSLWYVFPAHSKFSSPATKIFITSDKYLRPQRQKSCCVRLGAPIISASKGPRTSFQKTRFVSKAG